VSGDGAQRAQARLHALRFALERCSEAARAAAAAESALESSVEARAAADAALAAAEDQLDAILGEDWDEPDIARRREEFETAATESATRVADAEETWQGTVEIRDGLQLRLAEIEADGPAALPDTPGPAELVAALRWVTTGPVVLRDPFPEAGDELVEALLDLSSHRLVVLATDRDVLGLGVTPRLVGRLLPPVGGAAEVEAAVVDAGTVEAGTNEGAVDEAVVEAVAEPGAPKSVGRRRRRRGRH
jgi:hypothetical protein